MKVHLAIRASFELTARQVCLVPKRRLMVFIYAHMFAF